MARPVECINARPSQLWTKSLKYFEVCERLVLHLLAKLVELRLKLLMKEHYPKHI